MQCQQCFTVKRASKDAHIPENGDEVILVRQRMDLVNDGSVDLDSILPSVPILKRDYPGCVKGHLIEECKYGEKNDHNKPLIDIYSFARLVFPILKGVSLLPILVLK